MSSEERRREGQAAAKLAYEEGNGLVALYLVVECVVELEERIQQLEEALRQIADGKYTMKVGWPDALARAVLIESGLSPDSISREPSEAPEKEGEDG